MRKVYPREMVAHLWANRSQDEARNAQGNFYFAPLVMPGSLRASVMYSYGPHHVHAAFVDYGKGEVLLMHCGSASPTTNKHARKVRRALTDAQRSAALHVPGLSADLIRDPRLMVEALTDAAVSSATSALARRKTELRATDIAAACRHLQTAATLRRVAGAPRALAPFVGDYGSEEARQWAQRLVQRTERPRLREAARTLIAQLDATPTEPDEAHWQTSNWAQLRDRLSALLALLARVVSDAENCGLPVPAGVQAAVKRHRPMLASHTVKADAERAAELARRRDAAIRNAWHTLRQATTDRNNSREQALCTLADELPEGDPSRIRARRALVWLYAERSVRDVRSWLDGVRAKSTAVYGDCAAAISSARGRMSQMSERQAGAFDRLHGPLLREADSACFVWRVQCEAREARKLPDWLAGVSNDRPRLAQPVCRVRGNVVETTLGAYVPLDHAQRLARLARRALREGHTCAGAKVGHFTVTRIDHDGAVIGCHSFAASEMLRMLDILDPQNSQGGDHA